MKKILLAFFAFGCVSGCFAMDVGLAMEWDSSSEGDRSLKRQRTDEEVFGEAPESKRPRLNFNPELERQLAIAELQAILDAYVAGQEKELRVKCEGGASQCFLAEILYFPRSVPFGDFFEQVDNERSEKRAFVLGERASKEALQIPEELYEADTKMRECALRHADYNAHNGYDLRSLNDLPKDLYEYEKD